MLGLLEDYEKFISETKVHEFIPEEIIVEGVIGNKKEAPISLVSATEEEDKDFKNTIDKILINKPEYIYKKEEEIDIDSNDEKVAENIYTKVLKLEYELKKLEKSTGSLTKNVSSSFINIENMINRAKSIKTHIESFKNNVFEKNKTPLETSDNSHSLNDISMLSKIEERISRLENYIGYNDGSEIEKALFHNQCTNIKEILDILVKKIILLDENTLANVRTLQNEIILNIDALNSDYNNDFVLNYAPKIDETYKKILELISISSTLPSMISHLKSIQDFLLETSQMFQTIQDIQETQKALKLEIKEQKSLLAELQQNSQ